MRRLSHLARPRFATLAALAGVALALACIPSNPDADDDYVAVPLQPTPHLAHLRGRVRDFTDGTPVAGARVEAEGVSAITGADGSYAIGDLRVVITTLVTTKAGYDTSRVQIQLPHGDSQFDPRLRLSASLAEPR